MGNVYSYSSLQLREPVKMYFHRQDLVQGYEGTKVRVVSLIYRVFTILVIRHILFTIENYSVSLFYYTQPFYF